MRIWVWVANVLGWPVIQIGIARWALRQPIQKYEHDSWLTRERNWELRGRLYTRIFRVDHWKRFLPDGAVWMGGAEAVRLTIRGRSDCERFLAETRRAEQAHWYMLFCTPVFLLWNPAWAFAVMAIYGVLANIPCILAQRYNRTRAEATLTRTRKQRAPAK